MSVKRDPNGSSENMSLVKNINNIIVLRSAKKI